MESLPNTGNTFMCEEMTSKWYKEICSKMFQKVLEFDNISARAHAPKILVLVSKDLPIIIARLNVMRSCTHTIIIHTQKAKVRNVSLFGKYTRRFAILLRLPCVARTL